MAGVEAGEGKRRSLIACVGDTEHYRGCVGPVNSKAQEAVIDHRIGEYFTDAAATFDTFYDGKRGPFMRWVDRKFRSDVFVRFEWVFEEIGDAAGKSILDIGCGSGPYSVEAANRGAERVLGVDMADGMLEIARRRAQAFKVDGACAFVKGSFPQDAPDEQFDHAIVTGVMDYVADAPAFINTVQKLVRKSAILSMPSKHWFRTPFREWRYRMKDCPVYFFETDEIRRWFSEAGFAETDIRKVPGAGQDYVVIGRNG